MLLVFTAIGAVVALGVARHRRTRKARLDAE